MTLSNEKLTPTISIVVIVVLAGCVGIPGGGNTDSDLPGPSSTDAITQGSSPSGELEIHHIDVGQADSTLVVTPKGETILIDTGDWRDDGEEVISYLTNIGVKRIDHLVATHPHADHIGGHEAVIRTYESEYNGVGNIYGPGTTTTSNTFEEYLNAVESTSNEIFTIKQGDKLPLSDPNVSVRVLNPPSGGSDGEIHERSVALRLRHNGFRYVTTGDMEASREGVIVEKYNITADVYQAGHHGSRTSSSKVFIQEMNPEVAIISSAKDSQYGHPHEETLSRFSRYNIKTYWTATHGDIVVIADRGGIIDVKTERDSTTNPSNFISQTSTTGVYFPMNSIHNQILTTGFTHIGV